MFRVYKKNRMDQMKNLTSLLFKGKKGEVPFKLFF